MRSITGGSRIRSSLIAALALSVAAVLVATSAPAEGQPAVGNGAAKATALVTKFAPGVGSLELGITSGVAVAEVTNQLAQSQAQAIDLGLIGTTLTAEGCSGDASVQPEDLPQPVRVDNRDGDTSATRDQFPLAGSTIGGGRMTAAATTQPRSEAQVSGVGFSADPLLNFGGGKAVAEAEVLPGEGRQAHAWVETSVDIAGVVKLAGLRWEATHRTGTERMVEGSFQIGSAEVGGVDFPTDSVAPIETAVNTVLALSGVSVQFPRVEKFAEPTDLVRVTPMRIILQDSPAGGLLLGPGLNATREQREQLFDELVAIACDFGGLLLVGDITVTIIAGNGFFAIEFGGAEAISSDFQIGELIAALPPGQFVDTSGAEIVTTPGVPGTPGAPGTPGSSGSAVADSTDGQVVATRPAADIGPLERVCESIHPFDWPSCSFGAAPLAGLLGLLATAAVFGVDLRRQHARSEDDTQVDLLT